VQAYDDCLLAVVDDGISARCSMAYSSQRDGGGLPVQADDDRLLGACSVTAASPPLGWNFVPRGHCPVPTATCARCQRLPPLSAASPTRTRRSWPPPSHAWPCWRPRGSCGRMLLVYSVAWASPDAHLTSSASRASCGRMLLAYSAVASSSRFSPAQRSSNLLAEIEWTRAAHGKIWHMRDLVDKAIAVGR
jgi:hypothetical protein